MEHDDVVAAILAYVDANPGAADSAAGVSRWWLGGRLQGESLDCVEAALADLVSLGLLRCVSLADGSLLYSAPVGGSAARRERSRQ